MPIVRYPGGSLVLGKRTCIMGVLNVTPDSFSDGGSRWTSTGPSGAPLHGPARSRPDRRGGRTPARAPARCPPRRRSGASSPSSSAWPTRRSWFPSTPRRPPSPGRPSRRARRSSTTSGPARRPGDGEDGGPRRRRGRPHAHEGDAARRCRRTPRTMTWSRKFLVFLGKFGNSLSGGIERDRSFGPGDRLRQVAGAQSGDSSRLDEFRILGCPLAIGTSRKGFIGRALNRRVNDRDERHRRDRGRRHPPGSGRRPCP